MHAHATVIGTPGGTAEVVAAVVDGGWRGRLVAVTGPGGTGTSTVAMAVAQGLAADPRNLGVVCLADLALDADLAMFHDARDVVPGVQELVDAFRSGTPEPDAVRAMTFTISDRGYHLLLGLRNHRDWTAVRPRSFDAALDALRRTFRVVVADVDADLEGQDRTGSIDIEERNHFARRTIALADLVVVTGEPTTKGVHALVRTLHRLVAHGVDPGRLLPVVNHAPRSPRRRAELTRALAELAAHTGHGADSGLAGPVFLATRRRLDDLVNQSAPLPRPLVRPVTAAVARLLDTAEPAVTGGGVHAPTADDGARVVPGTLGAWSGVEDDDEAAG